jgi:hypothetical protein
MSTVGKRAPQWTGAELKIAREIKARGRDITIKECQHLLPGRTLTAIKQAVARQPGGKKVRGRISWVWPAVKKLLEKSPGLTNREIAECIGCTRNGVLYVTSHAMGLKEKKVYISGWSGNAPKYSLGNLQDVPKPPRRTKEEAQAIQTAQRRAKSNPFGVAMNQIMQVSA